MHMGSRVLSGPVRPLRVRKAGARLTDEAIAAYRERIAIGYYNQSQVIVIVAMKALGAGCGARLSILPS